jgi:hypothetical protein
MSMTCTRCDGTGFLNYDQIDDGMTDQLTPDEILEWIKNNPETEACVCDCCGDGEVWYGTPGEHYNSQDGPGREGVYGYNGGLCECH